jgi:hypothetical protein
MFLGPVVYDLLGRQVQVLVDEQQQPGNYEVTLDGAGLASGVYIYRMTARLPGQAGSCVQMRKMILVK